MTAVLMKTDYVDQLVQLGLTQYASDPVNALVALDPADGSLVAVLSVNPRGYHVGPDAVVIKNYSENSGVFDWLRSLNIIQPPHDYVVQGYVTLPVCTLNRDELAKYL